MSYRVEPTETAPVTALVVEIKQVAETLSDFLNLLEQFQVSVSQSGTITLTPAVDLPSLSGVGERTRFMRLVRGWSQAELADRTGISRATVNYVEKGKSHPNGATSTVLANALGCNHFWLVTGLGGPGLSPQQEASA